MKVLFLVAAFLVATGFCDLPTEAHDLTEDEWTSLFTHMFLELDVEEMKISHQKDEDDDEEDEDDDEDNINAKHLEAQSHRLAKAASISQGLNQNPAAPMGMMGLPQGIMGQQPWQQMMPQLVNPYMQLNMDTAGYEKYVEGQKKQMEEYAKKQGFKSIEEMQIAQQKQYLDYQQQQMQAYQQQMAMQQQLFQRQLLLQQQQQQQQLVQQAQGSSQSGQGTDTPQLNPFGPMSMPQMMDPQFLAQMPQMSQMGLPAFGGLPSMSSLPSLPSIPGMPALPGIPTLTGMGIPPMMAGMAPPGQSESQGANPAGTVTRQQAKEAAKDHKEN